MKIKREEGPTRNQTWGILKYLSAEFFTENQRLIGVRRRMNVGSNDTCRRHLRSKIGVWHLALALVLVVELLYLMITATTPANMKDLQITTNLLEGEKNHNKGGGGVELCVSKNFASLSFKNCSQVQSLKRFRVWLSSESCAADMK